jgi:non-heme chloroperoxidase
MTVAEVIGAFARAWNTDDDAGRARLLAACCVPDAVFVSPQGTITGTSALAAGIAEFRRTFPAAIVSFGGPDGHGGFVRVAWVTRWSTGRPELAGEDFAQLATDGRIRLLVSFDGVPQPCP